MNAKHILLGAGFAALSVAACAGTYNGGLGTETTPYQIGSAQDWVELTNTPADWNAWFVLVNDIDLAGVPLMPVGNSGMRFTGQFDGRYNSIKNPTILLDEDNDVGLFGIVGALGKVMNLNIVNTHIHGNKAAGGLVGLNHGVIRRCSVSGTVRGEVLDAGGLVGSNIFGAIDQCYAAVTVISAGDYAGGLAGFNWGDAITNSYASGDVSGQLFVGGFLGGNDDGYIIDCYSTGVPSGTSGLGGFAGVNLAEGMIVGCFWDTDTSGITFSDGNAQGRTTEQMQTQALYVDAGWDFDHVWSICDGVGYPRLQWQIPETDFVCPAGTGMEDLAAFSRCWLAVIQPVGDLTGDGTVGYADFAILSRYWQGSDCGRYGADLSGDGKVGIEDLWIFSAHWLHTGVLECRFADLSGDGFVGAEDLLILADQWLQGR